VEKVDRIVLARGEGEHGLLGKSAKPNPELARLVPHLLPDSQTNLEMQKLVFKDDRMSPEGVGNIQPSPKPAIALRRGCPGDYYQRRQKNLISKFPAFNFETLNS
jgi:hypothetical protein